MSRETGAQDYWLTLSTMYKWKPSLHFLQISFRKHAVIYSKMAEKEKRREKKTTTTTHSKQWITNFFGVPRATMAYNR